MEPAKHWILSALALAALGCSRIQLDDFEIDGHFRLKLAASGPDVADPVAGAFDERGRMWVVELIEYSEGTGGRSRVKILEDADSDGRFDRSSVFLDGLMCPTRLGAATESALKTPAGSKCSYQARITSHRRSTLAAV